MLWLGKGRWDNSDNVIQLKININILLELVPTKTERREKKFIHCLIELYLDFQYRWFLFCQAQFQIHFRAIQIYSIQTQKVNKSQRILNNPL